MTIAQMLTTIRFLTNTNSVTFTDANMYRLASERQKQLLHVLTGMKEGYLETTNSQNLVAGTQAYTIPASLRIKRAEVLYATGGTWRKVNFFDLNERVDATDSTSITADFSQSNPFGDVTADTLSLYPVPDANVTNGLKIWYVAMPADFTATTDTPVVPAEHHRLLADLVALDIRQMKGEVSAAQASQEETILMSMLKQNVSPRVTDQNSFVKPLYTSYE
jgi:hypothetical protein